ncbi:MAG: carbohydrate ABC transporter permease [Clostridia bacterium]
MLVLLFLPIATFPDAAVPLAQEKVDKQAGYYDKANVKLQELIQKNDDQEKIDKQRTKVAKEQKKLDQAVEALTAAQMDVSNHDIFYSLANLRFSDEIQIDNVRVNESGIYQPNLEQFPVLTCLTFILCAAAIVCLLLAHHKIVSKGYTFSAMICLLLTFVIGFTVLRVRALPIKAPYGDPQMTLLWIPLILCPLTAMILNVISVKNSKKTMLYLLCVALCVLSLLPFIIMMVNATRTTPQIREGVSLIPGTALLDNWKILTGKNFDVWVGMRNSAIISFSSTFLAVYFSAMTAYGLTVYEFKGRKLLYSLILGLIMIPMQVAGTGFYMFMYRIGWTNSFLPLIIPAIASPTTVFFMRQYLDANFQISLVEAARIDGAKELYTFNRIVMPILMPALATMSIFAVISSWNNYLTPLMLLSSANKMTLPMMVQMLRGDVYRTEYGSIYLGLSMTALPLLIVYFSLSKYIIAGVALGGVKE